MPLHLARAPLEAAYTEEAVSHGSSGSRMGSSTSAAPPEAHTVLPSAAAVAAATPPPSPPPNPRGALVRLLRRVLVECRDSLAADWHYNDEYDRFYWRFAIFVYGSYMAKLVSKLSVVESLQNVVMVGGLGVMAFLSGRHPAAYRRHGALLRMLLLTYAYLMPVLCSLSAMDAFSPAPSEIPYLHTLVDTYSLWLSSRNAFLAWAMVGCRPPLYLAVPYQLFGLWRINSANFCQAPVLQHPVMQQRTEVAHLLYSLGLVGIGGTLPWRCLVPSSPEGRCSALLLFYNIVFAFLVPLLLLVPLRQQAGPQRGAASRGSSRGRRGLLYRLECRIEGWLRLLMLPKSEEQLEIELAESAAAAAAAAADGGSPQEQHQRLLQRREQQRRQQEQRLTYACTSPVITLLLRWWVLLAVLWSACCVMAS